MSDRLFLIGLIRQGILVPLQNGVVEHHANGTALICDSQTRPTSIVKDFQSTTCDLLIANEAGILIASPDPRMAEGLGIDPEVIIIEPLMQVASRGLRQVVLCVNTWSSQMRSYDLDLIEIIDDMMRASSRITRDVRRVDVTSIVHVPSDDGRYANYLVTTDGWASFYREYEVEEQGRNDDPDDSQDSFDNSFDSTDHDFGDQTDFWRRPMSSL